MKKVKRRAGCRSLADSVFSALVMRSAYLCTVFGCSLYARNSAHFRNLDQVVLEVCALEICFGTHLRSTLSERTNFGPLYHDSSF